jgi:hypothetical protein
VKRTGKKAYAQQTPRKPEPWDTCTFIEGKGDYCNAADKARKFEDYLSIAWMFDPVDGFTVNTPFNYIKPAEHKINPGWQEMGRLGDNRVRSVRYLIEDAPGGAGVMLAERKDGLWIPLMKGVPGETAVVRNGTIIAISRDFGGNVPMVRTWAWTATDAGPMLINADEAPTNAIAKVGPGAWGCYGTEMEWDTLHNHTWCWLGEWINKGSGHYELNTWFELQGATLVPTRVVLKDLNPGGETKVWP